MRIRTGRAALGIVLTAAFMAGTAATAQAASWDGSCNDSEVCMYRLTYKDGGIADTPNNNSNYVGFYFSSGYTLNDRTSSIQNNANFYDVTHWTDAGGYGYRLDTGTNTTRNSLNATYDNKFSSHYF